MSASVTVDEISRRMERSQIDVLKHEIAELTSDRDHWRRYAGGLEARLESLGHAVHETPADEEVTLDESV